jgi:4-amino-4-deoxy-L-arabinose transferase-like glycosyltransferase
VSTALADPLSPSAYGGSPAHARPRRRWELWRSPEGQPSWARPVLLGVAAAAALLYARNITQAGLAPFYSVAVKSMSESWKAFFYGAFDPQATVTIDKLAGSFLPQALSARIFGFNQWSLALPQVIEGAVSILVMHRVVRRWAGPVPGLLAAGIFALTPIAASTFGHSMEDGALTMCLVLAADAYQRAVMEARLRSLAWAGVWVGLGFQAKMLQAWMVLPALAIGYLVAAPVRLRRRLWHISAAGIVMLAVSMSWIALYTFTPASDRPYVDGSMNNSAVAMVFGYNGTERFGISFPGSVTSGPAVGGGGGGSGRAGGTGRTGSPDSRAGFPGGQAGSGTGAGRGGFPARAAGGTGSSPAGGAAAGNGFPGKGGFAPGGAGGPRLVSSSSFGTGWTKLLGSAYAPEIGWLYPLAVLALIFGLIWRRRAERSDQVRGGFVFWGIWLLTFGLIFSKMSRIPHTAYMTSLAPPLAALSAVGVVMFWRLYRADGWRGWILPVAVAAELAWALFVWSGYGGFLPWARTAAVVAGVIAIIVLAVAKLSRRVQARLVTVGLAAGVAAMLAAPATWAASVLDEKYAGSSFNASTGPVTGLGQGMGGGGKASAGGASSAGAAERYGFRAPDGLKGGAGAAGGSGGPAGGRGGNSIATSTNAMTSAEKRLYDYLMAHRGGASYLMAVQSWNEASPYILYTGQEVMPMGGFTGSVPEPTLAHVKELVSSGQLRYFLINGTGAGRGFGGGSGNPATQAIASWVQNSCANIPASDYGGTSAGTSASSSLGTLYVCSRNS